MSKITLKLTDKRWRDEFGLSKLDSWIAPKKRTRWFFRTSQSDEDNSLDGSNSKIQRNDGTADNTKDVRQMSKTQQHDDQVSMKPRVITVHTTDDNLHLDHHLDDKTLNSSPAVAVSYTPKSRASRTPRQAQRSFSDKSFPESIKHSIASSNNDMEVSSNDSPCLYERTCYAITSTQTRCALLPCKGKHYCQIHSKEIHGTLLEESIYRIGDLQYKGKPGTTQCRALSKRGAQCALTSVVKWDLCRRHLRSTPQFIVSLVQKSTSTSAYSNFEQTGRKSEEKRRSRDNKEPTLESLSSNNSDYEGSDEVSSSANSLSSSTYDDSSSSDDTTKSFSETEKTRRSSSSSSCSSGSELVSKEIVLSHGASKQAYWQEPLEFDHSKDVTFTQNANEERCVYISSSGEECPYRTMDKEDAVYCQGHDVLTARLKYLLRTRSSDAPHKCHESDGNLSSEASDDDGERQHSPSRVHETRPYTHREFMRLWKKCEDFVGESTDDIENTKHVRSANKGLCPEDTNRQAKAQYGRLLPQAMKVRKSWEVGYYKYDLLNLIASYYRR